MIWWLYNLLFLAGFLVLLPRFFWRMIRRGGYARHFMQRLGCYGPVLRDALRREPRLWIHAVSVGELSVAFGLIERWRKRDPEIKVLLSTTTSTGRACASRRLAPQDLLIYFPVDLPWVVARVLRRIRPRMIVLIECELWPNLIRQATEAGVPVVLVNGRISEHSFRGYRRLRAFTRRLLPNVSCFAVQSAADAQRLERLGAPPARIWIAGSAKYDDRPVSPEQEQLTAAIRAAAAWDDGALVLMGGSTWPGEEAALLDLYARLKTRFPDLRLILAPRHAERAPELVKTIAARGRSVLTRRRLRPGAAPAAGPPEVLLIDSTGELRSFYAMADIVFVGKSLTRRGGQNVIEPAALGKPVLVGPHLENFPVVAEDFRRAGAFVEVSDAGGLEREIESLLRSPERRRELGRRAAELVASKAGVLDATLEHILPYSGRGGGLNEKI